MAAKSRRPRSRLANRFYARALSEAERADFPAALAVEGLDEEIALLRLRLRRALAESPEDTALMFKGIDLLAKLVARRYRLPEAEKRDLEESLAAALRGFEDLMAAGGEDA